MPLITGKQGAVLVDGQPVADVTRWSLTTKARVVAYSSSATGGAVRRIVTARTASGKLSFLVRREAAQHEQLGAGGAVELQLRLESGNSWFFPAVIETFQLEVDIATAEGIPGAATFLSDGNWTSP